MSRNGWIGAVAALVVVGVGAALAFGVLGGDEEQTPTAEGSAPTTIAEVLATTTTAEAASTTVPTPDTTASSTDGPFCAALDQMIAALDEHLPVEGADGLEAVTKAKLTFYTDAVDLVGSAELAAFEEVLVYEQALSDYHEANGWEPSRDLQDVVDNPPPTPPGGYTVVAQVFEDRCGVQAVEE